MSKVKLKLWPRFTAPLSNEPVVLALVDGPSVEVIVCGEASLLVQVTLVPTLIVSVGGEKAKPAIAAAARSGGVDRGVPGDAVGPPPLPPPPAPLAEAVAVGVLKGILLPPSPAATVGVPEGVLPTASGAALLTGAALATGAALLAGGGVLVGAEAVAKGLPAAGAASPGPLPPQPANVSSVAATTAAAKAHDFLCAIAFIERPSTRETREWFIARARALPRRRAS